jgi:two-component system heavy metal sensor histidine kinase CusS
MRFSLSFIPLRSLSSRLILLVGLTLVLSFVLLGTIIDRSIQHHFAQQDADELSVVTTSVKNRLQTLPHDMQIDEVHAALKLAVAGHHGVYFAIYSKQQSHFLYQPDDVDLTPLLNSTLQQRLSIDVLFSWETQQHAYRGVNLLGYMLDAHAVNILVASNMDFHMDFLARFRQTLWIIMSIVWLITMISAWWAVRVGHRPLHNISREIAAISADNLHTRLKPKHIPNELKELVESFNSMLSHVEEGFKRLSHFSADIAHELHTPLTNLATQTQVALSRPRNVDEYKEILYSNNEEYARLTKMVSDMLWLARTDNGLVAPSLGFVDLNKEIRDLFEYCEAWAEEAQVSFELSGEVSLQADKEMLKRAFNNLLSNAIKYSKANTKVKVVLIVQKNFANITFENHGETIPPQHLNHLFDRFYRVDPSRHRNADSSGLGLAIVKSIIDVHHGSIKVSSSNGLTTFKIKLPLLST